MLSYKYNLMLINKYILFMMDFNTISLIIILEVSKIKLSDCKIY